MSSNGTASAAPSPSSPASSPVSLPPSSNSPPQSSAPPSSSAPPQSSAPATSVVTASSKPPSTQIITSVVTPSVTSPGETPTPSVIVITSVVSGSQQPIQASQTGSGASSSTTAATVQNENKGSSKGGLGTSGVTAIAVVVPIVVIAGLVVAGIFLWKKRKQRKNAEEARRKEVEEYGYNPNNDPTLPAVGGSEMAEDQSGYRGWGNTSSTNRKASTTLTSGMTGYSDSGSNPGGYHSPGSPTQGAMSDGHSNDPLMNGRRETLDSEGIGALGAAPSASQNRGGDIHRGPSNASSSYSAANRSDNSGEYPLPNNHGDYYQESNYYQQGPYGDGGFGGGGQQPIIRDVSARRNTRIENPSVFPQQGNSGISQNF